MFLGGDGGGLSSIADGPWPVGPGASAARHRGPQRGRPVRRPHGELGRPGHEHGVGAAQHDALAAAQLLGDVADFGQQAVNTDRGAGDADRRSTRAGRRCASRRADVRRRRPGRFPQDVRHVHRRERRAGAAAARSGVRFAPTATGARHGDPAAARQHRRPARTTRSTAAPARRPPAAAGPVRGPRARPGPAGTNGTNGARPASQRGRRPDRPAGRSGPAGRDRAAGPGRARTPRCAASRRRRAPGKVRVTCTVPLRLARRALVGARAARAREHRLRDGAPHGAARPGRDRGAPALAPAPRALPPPAHLRRPEGPGDDRLAAGARPLAPSPRAARRPRRCRGRG